MPHYTDYKCSRCGKTVTADEARRGALFRKIVQFVYFGPKTKIRKSITTEFVCAEDLLLDPDFNHEAGAGPGQISSGLARVQRAQGTR